MAAVLPLLLLAAGCGERRPTGYMPTPVEEEPAGNQLVSRLQETFAEHNTWAATTRTTENGVTSTVTTIRQVEPLAVSMSLNGKLYGGRGRVIAVDNQVYAALPGRTPPGKYTKVVPGSTLGQLVTQITATSDPGKLYRQFGEATEVSLVESGEQLDRYELTLPDERDYTVWVTKEGVGRRIVTKLGSRLIDLSIAPETRPVTIRPPA